MLIRATSDIHGGGAKIPGVERKLPQIDPCDVAIIAGDICDVYNHSLENQSEWLEKVFYNWVDRIEAKHILVIAGNHDFILENKYGKQIMREFMPDNVTYLEDEGITIDGKTFYGTPWTPNLPSWAFQIEEGPRKPVREMARMKAVDQFAKIPPDLDVLISHGPPAGYGDKVSHSHVGSQELLNAIEVKQPRYVICGHIHEGFGHYRMLGRTPSTEVYCVSWLDRAYEPTHEVVEINI